jgi:hypothetical protein
MGIVWKQKLKSLVRQKEVKMALQRDDLQKGSVHG